MCIDRQTMWGGEGQGEGEFNIPWSALHRLAVQYLDWPPGAWMNLVVHHVLKTLIVGWTEEDLRRELATGMTVVHHLNDVIKTWRVMNTLEQVHKESLGKEERYQNVFISCVKEWRQKMDNRYFWSNIFNLFYKSVFRQYSETWSE